MRNVPEEGQGAHLILPSQEVCKHGILANLFPASLSSYKASETPNHK